MSYWRCVNHCGACCHLDPEARPDLEEYLSAEQLELYLSMVGAEGWCIHYDRHLRQCSIYDQRPRFCRVTPETFLEMYGIDNTEFNDFAIECCLQQIEFMYGEDSEEMNRFVVGL